jgi:hypothetical protein
VLLGIEAEGAGLVVRIGAVAGGALTEAQSHGENPL